MFNWPFDPIAIKYFYKLVRYNSDLKFVISSTWRLSYSIEELSKVFAYKGLQIPIIGFTKRIGDRDIEILEYIKNFKIKPKFCVIDDEIADLTKINKKLVVQTNYKIGFSKKDYNKVISILHLKKIAYK